jgi:hypothetical protein
MASFISTLFGGKYPSTATIESKEVELKVDYERFLDYEQSKRYLRYKELDKNVHSGDFIKTVEVLVELRYQFHLLGTRFGQRLFIDKNRSQ